MNHLARGKRSFNSNILKLRSKLIINTKIKQQNTQENKVMTPFLKKIYHKKKKITIQYNF